MITNTLDDYGWNINFLLEWEQSDRANLIPGRVLADYGQKLWVACALGESWAEVPARQRNSGEVIPAVGDWVALETDGSHENWRILSLLPRRTKFSRAAAGQEVKEQVVAANVDTVFLVQSLNQDFNLRRLERYLISSWESGSEAVVVLTKADVCPDVAEKIAAVQRMAAGVSVFAVSGLTGEGLAELRHYLQPGKTVALLGSSGVGKSTLVNVLAGQELLKTKAIREDDSRGRHTTTHRQLVLLPGGGLILDTPGMRALSLWEADAGMEAVFGDVEQLADQCRFHDCRHQNEPGCAIRRALQNGTLEPERWESWQKLQKEIDYLETRRAGQVRQADKQWGKEIAKIQKGKIKY